MDFVEFLEEAGDVQRIPAGKHLFRQGDADRTLYFVREGLLKAYYTSDVGKETVKSFIQAGDFIGSLTSAYLQDACSFNLVCMEPSILLRLDFDDLYAASREHLGVASALVDFLLRFAMKKERRELEFLNLSAEARYKLLCERSPSLVNRVRQKDIAGYLGITPVALSRIRKRRAQEQD